MCGSGTSKMVRFSTTARGLPGSVSSSLSRTQGVAWFPHSNVSVSRDGSGWLATGGRRWQRAHATHVRLLRMPATARDRQAVGTIWGAVDRRGAYAWRAGGRRATACRPRALRTLSDSIMIAWMSPGACLWMSGVMASGVTSRGCGSRVG